jgi:nucleoside-diphosphate-sugar epimerase
MLGRPELVENANPPQIDPLGNVIADATRLKSLGWQPEYTLAQGLKKLAASVS